MASSARQISLRCGGFQTEITQVPLAKVIGAGVQPEIFAGKHGVVSTLERVTKQQLAIHLPSLHSQSDAFQHRALDIVAKVNVPQL